MRKVTLTAKSKHEIDEGARGRIIERGRVILLSDGPEVGVEAICRAAGCSKGGFYHHFATKSRFLAEALASGPPPTARELVRLLPLAARDRDAAAALRSRLPTLLASGDDLDGIARLGAVVRAELGG